jgi:hypothetical protein
MSLPPLSHRCTPECRNAHKIFRERMEREGRAKELDERIKTLKAEGKNARQALYASMREMGFVSVEKERREHQAWSGRAMVERRREIRRGYVMRYQAKKRAEKKAAEGSKPQQD